MKMLDGNNILWIGREYEQPFQSHVLYRNELAHAEEAWARLARTECDPEWKAKVMSRKRDCSLIGVDCWPSKRVSNGT